MKKTVLLSLVLFYTIGAFAFEKVVSYSLFKTITKEEFQATMKKRHLPKILIAAHYTVDVYDVTYLSHWHDGSVIKASGLYYVPHNAKKAMPEIVYHHGTRMEKGRKEKLGGEESLCLGMAMDGYLVLQPDYIGLGYGDKFHLYQVASSEGQGSVDMLFAIRELNDSLKIKTNGMLFLTGYSEGGYSTLATHKLIQEKYSDQLHVTASSAMSGAYDMAGAQSGVMFKPYSRPHYLPYILNSYNEVYGFVHGDINSIYKTPYDTLIPHLFDGKHNINEVDRLLPGIPSQMLKDSFVNLFRTDPKFPFTVALQANNLYDWKPEAPVQLCYCDSDEQVTCRNSFVAYDKMRSNGAQHITLRRAGVNFTHSRCAIIASLYTKMYFDTFRNGSKYGGKGSAGKRFVASLAKYIVSKHKERSGNGEGRRRS